METLHGRSSVKKNTIYGTFQDIAYYEANRHSPNIIDLTNKILTKDPVSFMCINSLIHEGPRKNSYFKIKMGK